ncbi:MAG: hypothetical protein R3195_04470 [Gemmatimonadota bacterium]|nr:hypothetical protein [Gemmatimonadota bacterium]
MIRLALGAFLVIVTLPVAAQEPEESLRARLAAAPRLPLERGEFVVDPSVSLEEVSAVSVDAEGNLFVLHRPQSGDPIVVLDPEGRLIRSWGSGMFAIPHAIRIDPDGNVWTVDSSASTIYKFSVRGDLLLQTQLEPPARGPFPCGTADIAFGDNGHFLVADGYCNGRIVEFGPDGQQLREWGSRGASPGQFNVVHSLALGHDGTVYVADRENARLQRFGREGEYHGLWEYAGQLFGVAFSPAGELYVSVSLGGEPEEAYVMKLDANTGEILGYVEAFGHELAFAPDGSLIPATVTDRILVFTPR